MNNTIFPCDKAIGADGVACSCLDCVQACPHFEPYPPPPASGRGLLNMHVVWAALPSYQDG